MSSETTRDYSPPNSSKFTFVPHPLNNDIVIEEIISYLAIGDEAHLLNYRLISHKWNSLIIRKLKKSGRCFQISLGCDPGVSGLIVPSVASRVTNQVLESAMRTLRGCAARLTFDTIIVGHGLYFSDEVMVKWEEFLKMVGGFIRHLKFNNNRSAESTEESLHEVVGCEDIVSMQSLRAAFSGIPALETLEFCLSNQQSLFPRGHVVPRLHKLTKITFVEPRGFAYDRGFLNNIFSMAPNLTAIYSKPSDQLVTLAMALNAKVGPQRVTTLGIDNAVIKKQLHSCQNFVDRMVLDQHIRFPFLKLTTLELNNIFGEEEILRTRWVNNLLQTHSSTLVKLVLGTRKKNEVIEDNIYPLLPSVMKSLKTLEVNLSKFAIGRINSYEEQFPVLQSLTVTGRQRPIYGHGSSQTDLKCLLPGRNGESSTLQKFSLIGCPLEPSVRNEVESLLDATFPMAEYHFDS